MFNFPKDSNESLIQPTFQGYRSLAQNLQEYAEVESLPLHLTTRNLLHDFMENQGKYHKVCRLRFNSKEINRLSKKKKQRVDVSLSSTQTKNYPKFEGNPVNVSCIKEIFTRSHTSKPDIKLTCLFCEKEDGSETLVSATTLDIGPNIYTKKLCC